MNTTISKSEIPTFTKVVALLISAIIITPIAVASCLFHGAIFALIAGYFGYSIGLIGAIIVSMPWVWLNNWLRHRRITKIENDIKELRAISGGEA